jgi:hypothetical protein
VRPLESSGGAGDHQDHAGKERIPGLQPARQEDAHDQRHHRAEQHDQDEADGERLHDGSRHRGRDLRHGAAEGADHLEDPIRHEPDRNHQGVFSPPQRRAGKSAGSRQA